MFRSYLLHSHLGSSVFAGTHFSLQSMWDFVIHPHLGSSVLVGTLLSVHSFQGPASSVNDKIVGLRFYWLIIDELF